MLFNCVSVTAYLWAIHSSVVIWTVSTSWLLRYEGPKIVQLIEAKRIEGWLWGLRQEVGVGVGLGWGVLVEGTKFQLCKMNEF